MSGPVLNWPFVMYPLIVGLDPQIIACRTAVCFAFQSVCVGAVSSVSNGGISMS